jgi:hypothetical protein
MSERVMVAADSKVGSLYGFYLLALGAALVGNLLLRIGYREGWFGQPAGIVVALVSAVPLALAAGLFWRMVQRHLDEMLQRIVLEGFAFALVIFIPLAALYVNMATAGFRVPRLDAPDILLTPAILVALGIAISARRYR